MKKKAVLLLIVGIFLTVILTITIIVPFIRWAFVQVFFAEPTIIETYISPDGKHTAYVFESNGGATTDWIYHISILPSEKKLGKGTGNIYISDIPPYEMLWIDNNTLFVGDYRSVGTTKRKVQIYDITVVFNSLVQEHQTEDKGTVLLS